MFAYTSVLHLYIVHIRYFMTMMHGRLDERHRRPLNLDHLKFVTVGTCKLNNIYNLEQMLMLGPEDIAALFLFRRALYVVRFRQAVQYMMQYHLLWAIKPRKEVQNGVVEGGVGRGGKKAVEEVEPSEGTLDGARNDSSALGSCDNPLFTSWQPRDGDGLPDGLPIDDEDYDDLMNPKKNPKKKRKLSAANTTGYRGVYKSGKRFQAQIRIDRKTKYLGTYDTPKEAALAYDRAVIQHKLPSSKLNFPNDYTTSSEDDESSEQESGDSSSSDSCHSSDDDDDDESDEEDAVETPPSPQARPYFERDPFLDQLFAESQNKQDQVEEDSDPDTLSL
jgi:hypothetical protein